MSYQVKKKKGVVRITSVIFLILMLVFSMSPVAGLLQRDEVFAATATDNSYLRWPLSTRARTITSLFGKRKAVLGSSNHEGIDIGAPGFRNLRVHAVEDGKIIAVDTRGKGDYGKWIDQEIKLDGKIVIVSYCHLSEIRVKKDDVVKRGTFIGRPGNTGKSDGPHLHIEFRSNNIPFDPLKLFNPSDYDISPLAKDEQIKSSTPTVDSRYLRWPLSTYARTITSLFGYRNDVKGSTNHTGIDIATPRPKNTRVHAIEDGVIRRVDTRGKGAFGKRIEQEIILDGKKVIVSYCHLSEIRVKKGDVVKRGRFLGLPGMTGFATGNHLHIEFSYPNGRPFDPLRYFNPSDYDISRSAKKAQQRR